MALLEPVAPDLLAQVDQFIRPPLMAIGGKRNRRLAREYVYGLLGPGERKTAAPIAQRLSGTDQTPAYERRLRGVLCDEQWSHAGLMSAGASRLVEQTGGWQARTLDDTALLKKGTHSVGVANQYAGCLDALASCQVLVTIGLASEQVSSPVAARLFLPPGWDQDETRRAACHVPAHVRYQPKWQIALSLLERMDRDGLPDLPVLGDALYGVVTEFRVTMQQRGRLYVVGAPLDTKVWRPGTILAIPSTPGGRRRPYSRLRPLAGQVPIDIKTLAKELAAQAWHRVCWRYGSRGPQGGRFAALRVRPSFGFNGISVAPQDLLEPEWLLLHWPQGEPEPTKAWLSNFPESTALETLVGYARLRWRIERDYQEGKGLVGLDHYEGRTWHGLHHHAALVVLSQQFLALQRYRALASAPEAQPGQAQPVGSVQEGGAREAPFPP
jgi:SRSO17 transposase